jgi:aminomethyltransferase
MHLLRHTPLYELHVRLGGRMVPFAGYALPVQYPTGIIKEHRQARNAAALFDVSHMGQIRLRPRSGRIEDAARALEALLPNDILGLAPGRQRYAFLTNAAGGVIDDLMAANHGDHLMLVVNAARKDADAAHLQDHLSQSCLVEVISDRALVALQGPAAEAALAAIAAPVRSMKFMDVRVLPLLGCACAVSRSGYTGEDGFEIAVPAERAEELCAALLRNDKVAPAGLGARDSLRLEAGLCLYGSDLDCGTTPVEAALEWAIPKARRRGGARAGSFLGAETILAQLERGATRRRVGLRPEGRAPVRGGAPLFATEDAATPVGAVTSGGFGVSLDAPVAMGYVPIDHANAGSVLFAEQRGKRLPVEVCKMPFVPPHHARDLGGNRVEIYQGP